MRKAHPPNNGNIVQKYSVHWALNYKAYFAFCSGIQFYCKP